MAALHRVVSAVALLLAWCAAALGGGRDYCSISPQHTMCLYQGYGAACNKVLHSGTTKAEAKDIVEAHNRLRNKVAAGEEGRGNPGPQPSAADMKALVWDDELATIAQRWADQCTFKHDACRKVERFEVGQNVYISSTTGAIGKANWQKATQAWYDEVKHFSKNNVDRYQFSSKTGHYSQVAWANSQYVGCGYTAYTGADGWNSELLVCNYGPAGNVLGGRVYTKGKSCSQCPHGCHSAYPALCA